MLPSVEVVAPAKVNLGLRITGVRSDGYHTLDSLFVPTASAGPGALCDTLGVAVETGAARGVALTLEGPAAAGVPEGSGNLVVRAAEAFLAATGTRARVTVVLSKRIPSGAGLGGGSSDAAAVLRALAELLPGRLVGADRSELAARLGADVPFFLEPRPMRVRGVGEQLEAVAGVPALCLLIAHPGISLATSQVYAAWDQARAALTPPGPRPTMRPVSASSPAPGAPGFAREFCNDLEEVATRLCPAIGTLRSEIERCGAQVAGMSGSGSAVFGVFADEAEAARALEGADFPEATWARVVRTVASPAVRGGDTAPRTRLATDE